MTREIETPNGGDPRVFWIRMEMSDAKTPQANEADARRVHCGTIMFNENFFVLDLTCGAGARLVAVQEVQA